MQELWPVQCSKLSLFLSHFLATFWSKKVARYKMAVAKNKTIKLGGVGGTIFSLVASCAKLHEDKTDEIQDGCSTFSVEG